MNVAERAGSDSGRPQTPPLEGAGKTSAISSKITSILSASYADIELRDALETLDTRELQNDADTPRNLRRDVQREIIDCNGEVVQDFGHVALQLRTVGKALEKLRNTCEQIGKHVALARMETAPMLDEAKNLISQKDQVDSKQNLLAAFSTHFVLDESQVACLTSSTEPVDDNFFQVMVKAKRIHKDSQVLLASENQRLGLEILDQSSKFLNAGYQKLYRWIQREFKELDLENPRISSSVRRALRILAERPTLFQDCLDAFAEAREQSLLDAFHTALTGSDRHTGQQRPIEFSAHEPLRYVGDMLAWSHATTVSEREALEGLFVSDGDDEISKGIEEGLESEPWSRGDNDEKFDGKKALKQLIDQSLAGVAQLLQQRIEQVIRSHSDSVLSYKVANLVAFYKNIFRKLIDDSGFLETLSDTESAALDQFRADMRQHKLAVETEHTSAPSDLSSPEFLSAALESLQCLLKSYETSITSKHATESGLELLLTEALYPFLNHCDELAQTLPDPSSTIFSVNCRLEARSSLADFSFTFSETEAITAKLDADSESLTVQQHAFLLDTSGLRPLLSAVAPLKSDGGAARLSTLPPFALDALAATSEQLDAFLPSAVMDATERLKSIRHGSLARDATAEAAERFCTDFEVVEQMILAADATAAEELGVDDESGGDGENVVDGGAVKLRDIFPRTGEEIRILLT